MKLSKKLSLAAFLASMMTALQGCSLKDAGTAAFVLLALMLPGCPIQDDVDVQAALSTGEVLAALIISTKSFPANTPAGSTTAPADTVTIHVLCTANNAPNSAEGTLLSRGEADDTFSTVWSWTGANELQNALIPITLDCVASFRRI